MRSQPIILCDVDEVVADLLSSWVALYNVRYNDYLWVRDITDWDLTKFVKPECGSKIYDLLKEPDFYQRVNPVLGAYLHIQNLRKDGYRVVFVTSCIRGSSDQKVEWLVRHGFIDTSHTPDDVVCVKDKSLLRGDLLIDDGPHNIIAAQSVGMNTILVEQAYNRKVAHPNRIKTWHEIERKVRELVPIA